jgi:AraC-like DNA-binding protein
MCVRYNSGFETTGLALVEVAMTARIVKPRGILNPKMAEQKFQLSRHVPAPDLAFFVERYWIIHWDLRGQAPYVQEVLTYPCVNLAIEQGKSGVFGVITGKSAHLIEGKGKVFGVKFKPGGFYPFVKSPVSPFTDRVFCLRDVFDVDESALEEAILSLNDDAALIKQTEHFLRARLPEQDETVTLINQIIECIIADRTITRVDDVLNRLNLNKRTLQRLFNQYVGVSPKWVIKRYRLHEAAEQLENGNAVDLPRLALDLGYFDQPHFIKDFKTLVGRTPTDYAKEAGKGTGDDCRRL